MSSDEIVRIDELEETGKFILQNLQTENKESSIQFIKNYCDKVWEFMISQCEQIGNFNEETLQIPKSKRDHNKIKIVGQKWKKLEQLCLKWLFISRFIWNVAGKGMPEYLFAFSHAGENKNDVMALKNQFESKAGLHPSRCFIDKEMVHGDSVKIMQHAFGNCEFGFVKMTEYSVCKKWPLMEQLIFRTRLAIKENMQLLGENSSVLNRPDANFKLIIDAVETRNWSIIGYKPGQWIDVVKDIANPFFDNLPCAITQRDLLVDAMIKITKNEVASILEIKTDPNSSDISYPYPALNDQSHATPLYQSPRNTRDNQSAAIPALEPAFPKTQGNHNSSVNSIHPTLNVPSNSYHTNVSLPIKPTYAVSAKHQVPPNLFSTYNSSPMLSTANTFKLANPSRDVPRSVELQIPPSSFQQKNIKLEKAIAEIDKVTEINLDSSSIREAGAQSLANALEKNTTLTSINLRNNNIGEAGVQSLARALEKNTTLTTINLDSNYFREVGVQPLASTLEKNTTLTSIDLRNNNIGEVGVQSVARALEKNTTLTSIDLSFNIIREAGAQSIARALEKNTTLTSINLRDNYIRDTGAQSLARALETNTTLTSISLLMNHIGEAGAQSLARALEKNISLTSINLSFNNIGEAGAQSLARALETNTTLTFIDLRYSNIREAGAQSLARALEKNTTLISIGFGDHDIGFIERDIFQSLFKRNKLMIIFKKWKIDLLVKFFIRRPPNTGFTNFVRCCRYSLWEVSKTTGPAVTTTILLYLCHFPPHFDSTTQNSLSWKAILSGSYAMEMLVEITKQHLLQNRKRVLLRRNKIRSLYGCEFATTAIEEVVGKKVSHMLYEKEK